MTIEKNVVFISDKIREHAGNIPNQTAIIAQDITLTYKDLDMLSDRVAYALLSAFPDMEKETPIGLLLDRKSYVFPLEIGIIRAGFAYVPMTDEYPEERIQYCIENAGGNVLITTTEILNSKPLLKEAGFKILFVEEILSYDGKEFLLPEITADQLTHILYTSGSTGVPKGVRHNALSDATMVCTENGDAALYEFFNCKKICMSLTQISFVVSMYDYAFLYNGGSIVFPAEEDFRDMSLLAEKMIEYEVDGLFATPSFINSFLDVKGTRPAFAILEILVVIGEILKDTIMERIFTVNPWIHLINAYGSTETKPATLTKLITSDSRTVSVGKPSPLIKALIIRDDGSEADNAEMGELLIAGPTVTEGYQGNISNNTTAFTVIDGERFYKTGDLAYKDHEGDYYIVSRKDDMVKYHGQRVELGEIESVLSRFEGIKLCKVLMKNNGSEDYLAAFYTSDIDISNKELSEFLKKNFLHYFFLIIN